LVANRNDTPDRDPGEEQSGVATGRAAASDPPSETTADSMAERLKVLQAEKDDLLNTLVRRQADFENYRKRVEREQQHERHRGVENLIEKLLPIMDGFDRALAEHGDAAPEEYRRGFELIYKQLSDALAKQGLERIDATGQEFNPHLHHAIERVQSTDYPDGTVMNVFQAGYKFHNKILRPAMVRVATHPATVSHDSASKKH
jgi:molecular chaperone GrpE